MKQERDSIKEHYGSVALDIREATRLGKAENPEGHSQHFGSGATQGEASFLYDDALIHDLPRHACSASRGCGDPVLYADLKPGESVLDLGSGGGIDALIAARLVGSRGRVCGIDMTPQMIDLARENAANASCSNVEFIEGDIEHLPFRDASFDVVISNCVINFSDDKPQVMKEAFRVLNPDGRFVFSDIVAFDAIPSALYDDLCALTGCLKGIQQEEAYRATLRDIGFTRMSLERKTLYTDEVLAEKARRKGRENLFERIAGKGAHGVTGSVIVYASH